MLTKQLEYTCIPPPVSLAELSVMMRSVCGVKYIVELEQSRIPPPDRAELLDIFVELENTRVDSMASIAEQLLETIVMPFISR